MLQIGIVKHTELINEHTLSEISPKVYMKISFELAECTSYVSQPKGKCLCSSRKHWWVDGVCAENFRVLKDCNRDSATMQAFQACEAVKQAEESDWLACSKAQHGNGWHAGSEASYSHESPTTSFSLHPMEVKLNSGRTQILDLWPKITVSCEEMQDVRQLQTTDSNW